MTDLIPAKMITDKIFLIRACKVMLDRDLAELYGVQTKVLKQAVRRNIERFPDDFMFELDSEEFEILRSQIVTSSWGGARYVPMAFTELGVAMLSSVLRTDRAIQVNIQIMRTFSRFRQLFIDHEGLQNELENLKKETDAKFEIVFETFDHLLNRDEAPMRKIGFTAKEKQKGYGKK